MAWKQKGHSHRQTMTEALLLLSELNTRQSVQQSIQALNDEVGRLTELAEQINLATLHGTRNEDDIDHLPGTLSDTLITAIKQSVKPGLKVDESMED